MPLRTFAIVYFACTAMGTLIWWVLLLAVPSLRLDFKANGAPDVTLLAFGIADGLLFVGTGIACGIGFAYKLKLVKVVLLIHTGAAAYASLYCMTLTVLTNGDAWRGAVFMAPSLFVPGIIAWHVCRSDVSAW